LKTEYCLQNLFTFQDLLKALNRSLMVAVHPASPDFFLDYNKLIYCLYRPLASRKISSFLTWMTDYR
jgi:hypothetical protein